MKGVPATSVKKAVENSIHYFSEVLNPADIRLEEIELSDDERYWFVTLSALVPSEVTVPPHQILAGLSTMAEVFKKSHERVYKQFKVSSSDGEVRAMKIRELEKIGG